jgi:hypothetical protein
MANCIDYEYHQEYKKNIPLDFLREMFDWSEEQPVSSGPI